MSRDAAPGHPEQQLLAAPRPDALVTAVVIVITAGVFAVVAGHATLIRIQRLDDAWLQLMISGRSAPSDRPVFGVRLGEVSQYRDCPEVRT